MSDLLTDEKKDKNNNKLSWRIENDVVRIYILQEKKKKEKKTSQPQTRQTQDNDFSQRLMSAAENNIYKGNYIALHPVLPLP